MVPIKILGSCYGCLAGYNIRTDRFELAVDAMDYVSRSKYAQREARMKIVNDEEIDGEAKSTVGE